MMPKKLSNRIALLAAATLPLTASFASAQYMVDKGNARDANNRIGSGGYNNNTGMVMENRIGGLTGNAIVTGNVTQGRAFRGALGYRAQTDFRGNLGSANFDNFIRDSTGVGQIRGTYGGSPANTPQVYYGPGRTVAPPQGFTRNMADSGAFVPNRTNGVLPNDSRIDYGGATRAQIAQSFLDNRQTFGTSQGLAPTMGQQFSGVDPNTNQSLQLSEYTSLARQRRAIFAGPNALDGTVTDPNARTLNAGPGNPLQPTTPSDANDGTARPDNRLNSGTPIGGQPTNDLTSPGRTGQGSVRGGVLDDNPQYAALRNRLAQAQRDQSQSGSPRAGVVTPGSETTGGPPKPGVAQPGGPDGAAGGAKAVDAGGTVSTGQGRDLTASRGSAKPAKTGDGRDAATGTDASKANNPSQGTGRPDATATPAATPAPTDTAAPKPAVTGGRSVDEVAPDKLQLPRPEAGSSENAATPAGGSTAGGEPVRITSLATGVKNQQLGQILGQAESLMKEGKFSSAIDAYDRAEDMATDDPLVFMGRSIAELGGSYYRKSEVHLRQAFAGDPALLYAKFDLRALLGDERLNFLITDLNEVARTNANDPGPVLLLAFIYYNGGMEDRAQRALDLAQTRAGGKDNEVKLLREHWKFGDAADAQNK